MQCIQVESGQFGYILGASMPNSHPDINTYEQLLPNLPPSDQLWTITPTIDQLYLPQIDCPDDWSAVPNNDYLSLLLISSLYY